MKIKWIFTVFTVFFAVYGCSKKCGEDVHVGTYELTAESKENWFPYLGVDSLVYHNESGDKLTFFLAEHSASTPKRPFRTNCNGTGWAEYSSDYYIGDILNSTYIANLDNIVYSLNIILTLEPELGYGEPEELVLYDMLEYHLNIYYDHNSGNFAAGENYITGETGFFIADTRGNTLDMEVMEWKFERLAEHGHIELNGNTYKDVWSISDYAGKKIYYFQEKSGVIAFIGEGDKLWIKSSL